ncbi:putative Zn(II)2Cys6 transcription factor [Microthyrium microscopicum]|uniref:Putative Zn(II)2Cys6 transcription factor n=1 Tax=Microthyrium microscopicum TaxID=703497 RepID=A0A6A6UBX8_9PEZI|nr:putative Zn(II)2Cys6 transcription factor [Microthyrium microscopicum]
MADSSQRSRPPPNRRRDKAQLSCDSCKRRKLKCDRQHPCGACSRRARSNSCEYATTSTLATSPTPDAQSFNVPGQSTSLHGRISELESLVVTLMQGQSLPSPLTPTSLPSPSVFTETQRPEVSQEDAAFPVEHGTLRLSPSGTSYVQSAHWEAILTKVRGLKEDAVTGSSALPGSPLFYGTSRYTTRGDILAALPPRTVVDRLMALHFDSFLITPYLIHCKKFLREYETFWNDPSATSIAWIGLMFSMLYIAAQLQTFTIDPSDERAGSLRAEYLTMKDGFRNKAVQCLVLARYTMGGPYILETLIMILTGEFILLKNSATDGWLTIGMILKLAMRMGYHRDPEHFPAISPFDGEMRRRLWTTIIVIDLALSLEMGLPRNATDTQIDTKQPRNLADSDFDENTAEMPPPRPETEWTPVLPLIAKGRLISALGKICDFNTDIIPPSHDEVLKADALLEDIHNHATPIVLRWGAIPHAITDSPNLVISRVCIELTYYKSRILLYRRALIGDPIEHSRKRNKDMVRNCLESALKILSFQQMLYDESQPCGRLCQLRWKVTHISNQDVLLATSVLCLYLQDVHKLESLATAPQATRSPTAKYIREQLTISHNIWLRMSPTSVEAAKVAKALSIVLGKTEEFPEDGSTPVSYDFFTDLDDIPMNAYGATFGNEYPFSGFSDPLDFFNNVLETGGS